MQQHIVAFLIELNTVTILYTKGIWLLLSENQSVLLQNQKKGSALDADVKDEMLFNTFD